MVRTTIWPTRIGHGAARRFRKVALEVLGLEERTLLSDTTAPVTMALIGGSAVVGSYQAAAGTTTVTIDLSATDPDNASNTLTTEYSTDSGVTFTKGDVITLSGDGTYNVEYFSVDPAGNVETMHTLVVSIGQTSATTMTVTANPNTLWPPNHKDVAVTISGTVTTIGGANTATTVSYNVLDQYSPGGPILTGTAPVNADGSYSFQVMLQASRLGTSKDGRTYTINVTALNAAQTPLASNFTTVLVPHDQGGGSGGGGGSGSGSDQDTIDRDFIDAVFLVVLDRQCDPASENYFAQQMLDGMSPAQVTSILQNTPEAQMKEINQLYMTVLDRPADAAGLALFKGWLQAGATPRMVEQALLTSPEFNADHPGNADFVNTAYQATLGRAADPAGQAYFLGLLNAGVSRDIVIADLLYSPEEDQDIVAQVYLVTLNRQPDPDGDQFFLGALEAGWCNRDVIMLDLVTSSEFYQDSSGSATLSAS